MRAASGERTLIQSQPLISLQVHYDRGCCSLKQGRYPSKITPTKNESERLLLAVVSIVSRLSFEAALSRLLALQVALLAMRRAPGPW